MFRIVGVSGKDQDEHLTLSKPLHDASSPVGSHFDVAWSDPTSDSSGLELVADRVCDPFVLAGTADKDPGLHTDASLVAGSAGNGEMER
jgi:hypothetical protein